MEKAILFKVDFHTHTCFSPDCITTVDSLIKTARLRGLDKLVVTDHNTLRGALAAHQAAPDLVIMGEEVQTTEGEFLAAYVSKPLPRHLEPMEALKRLKDQNAFISISHPFDPNRSGWSLETLKTLAPLVDAIEVLNARVLDRKYNQDALEFAIEQGISGTAGSDAHHQSEIARVYTLLPDFHDSDSLRIAIQTAEACGEVSSPFVHFYSSWARLKKAMDRE